MENINSGKSRGFKGLTIALVLFGVVVLTAALTLWLAKLFLFPKAFQPVQLSASEQTVLDQKIRVITATQPVTLNRPGERQKRAEKKAATPTADAGTPDTPLTPERYDETDANRKISLNERELNALLARNTDLAGKVAIDLSKNMASLKVLIPLDPELPIFGGKTLKVTAGLELHHDRQKTSAILKGVSIWGVPVPNAWLGGMKNEDLIKATGVDSDFWTTLSAGIDNLRVEDGHLTIQLAK